MKHGNAMEEASRTVPSRVRRVASGKYVDIQRVDGAFLTPGLGEM